jgi:hypothetical protein
MISTRFIDPPFLKGSGSCELKAIYVGPLDVIRKVSPTSYALELLDSIRSHPVIYLEYQKGFHESPGSFASRDVLQ